MNSSGLIADDVSYRYSDTATDVIARLSFAAAVGERVGIAGPNGVGKTTLLDLCSGVLRPTSGLIRFAGVPIHKRPQVVVRIDADFDMFEYLTLEQNVRFFLHFYRVSVRESELTAMLVRYQLDGVRARLAVQSSRGMRRKAQLVTTILAAPALLIADESFDGLDEDAQARWHEDLCHLSERGCISLLTLHSRATLEAVSTLTIRLPFDAPAGVPLPARGLHGVDLAPPSQFRDGESPATHSHDRVRGGSTQ